MAKRNRPTATTLDYFLLPFIEKREFTAWCERAGVRPQTVTSLLAGAVKRPHRATVLAIAKALGVSEDVVRSAIEAQRAGK